MLLSPDDARLPQNLSNPVKAPMTPPSLKMFAYRRRALSESHLLNPRPFRMALKSAKRAFQASRPSASGLLNERDASNDEPNRHMNRIPISVLSDSKNLVQDRRPVLKRAGSGPVFSDLTHRAPERRPAVGQWASSLSFESADPLNGKILIDLLPFDHGKDRQAHFGSPTLALHQGSLAQPPPVVFSGGPPRHLIKRGPPQALEPSPLTTEESADSPKVANLASDDKFDLSAAPPHYTPRCIFEEFERAFRAEDELLRAQFAQQSPETPDSQTTPPVVFDRERILREDELLSSSQSTSQLDPPGVGLVLITPPLSNRLLSPAPSPSRDGKPGLGMAFDASAPRTRPGLDELENDAEPTSWENEKCDPDDPASPENIDPSSRMMNFFRNYWASIPQSWAGSSPFTSSPRHTRPHHTVRDELDPRPAVTGISHELFPRTPAISRRPMSPNVSLVITPNSFRDERSPASDDGAGESPQTPSTNEEPTVRVGKATEDESYLTPPRIALESQLEKFPVSREVLCRDATPPARPPTPETERRSAVPSALSTAAPRVVHFQVPPAVAQPKVRQQLDNTNWLHWPSGATTHESREPQEACELVGRVLFDEGTRSNGINSLKKIIGFRRGAPRNTVSPIVSRPLIQGRSGNPQPTIWARSVPPPGLASDPAGGPGKPLKFYGKRQGFLETGNWNVPEPNEDIQLRPLENTSEDKASTLKFPVPFKDRIVRRAARASISVARMAATGLGIIS